MEATATPTKDHYFAVSVMDDTRSFWTFAAALDDLRVRSARCSYIHGRICVGDIYAYDATTGRAVTGSDFGRAISFYDLGEVTIKVPVEGAHPGDPWVVLP